MDHKTELVASREITGLSRVFGPDQKNIAHLRLFKHLGAQDGYYTAILTDLDEWNPGASVTNAIECLAEAVVEEFHIHPDDLRLIEHYDHRRSSIKTEAFDTIAFAWHEEPLGWVANNPSWVHAEKPEIEANIGQSLDESASACLRPKTPRLKRNEPPIWRDGRTPKPHDDRRTWPFPPSERRPEPTYVARRLEDGDLVIACVDGNGSRPIPHYVKHSPDGLDIGYGGSGPADAARCILRDALDLQPADPDNSDGIFPEIESVYQRFKAHCIAGADRSNWEIPRSIVITWYEKHKPTLCPHRRIVRLLNCETAEAFCKDRCVDQEEAA